MILHDIEYLADISLILIRRIKKLLSKRVFTLFPFRRSYNEACTILASPVLRECHVEPC
ncbi:hypothetical protein D3C79_1010990 [compost metagenome]